MPSKTPPKNNNSAKELEKNVAPLLVMNNSDLKPFIELFEHHPENVYQQPLGSLVGFFEIRDYSEDSAYVVNFLMSVLKKEYYANPKRPVADSLDSALHKVNVALSELAKHENVSWLGKLDGVVCVMEKNSVHFSVTGKGHLFIFRNKFLTNISEDLAPDASDPHPFKTFVDVSSGRIEENDKLLLFSDDLLQVLPLAQLKKNLGRFSRDEFVQFLKTALTNELEMTAALVIDVLSARQPKIKNISPEQKSPSQFNAFSQQTYSKQEPKLSEDFTPAIPDQAPAEKEYTDKKTGHIYVQGEGTGQDSSRFGLFAEIAKERLAEAAYHAKNAIKKRSSVAKKGIAQALTSGKKSLGTAIENARERARQKSAARAAEKAALAKEREIEQARQKAQEEAELSLRLEQEKKERFERESAEELARQQKEQERLRSISVIHSEEEAEKEPAAGKQIENIADEQIENIPVISGASEKEIVIQSASLREKIERMRQELDSEVPGKEAFQEEREIETGKAPVSQMDQRIERIMGIKRSEPAQKSYIPNVRTEENRSESKAGLEEDESAVRMYIEKTLAGSKRLVARIPTALKKQNFVTKTSAAGMAIKKAVSRTAPHYSKISSLFRRLTKKQKIVALAVVLAIIIVPVAIGKLSAPKKQAPTATVQAPPALSQTLAQDKNISLSTQTSPVASQSGLVSVLSSDSVTYAITPQKIIALSGGAEKEYPLPNQSGNALASAYMKDLNMIFILTDQKKIVSFSPVSKQFADNAISIPSGARPKFIATYLTYLYMPDSSANQIYRYPRATGGFGDKTDWYKDTLSLSNITDMTIDDSVYFVINNKIVKLFKGKNQNVAFEDSKTPISFDKIYTNVDSQSLFVLDAKNARLIQYDKNGAIQNQYFNESLLGATTFTVDEQNKTAFIAAPSGLLSLAL